MNFLLKLSDVKSNFTLALGCLSLALTNLAQSSLGVLHTN